MDYLTLYLFAVFISGTVFLGFLLRLFHRLEQIVDLLTEIRYELRKEEIK